MKKMNWKHGVIPDALVRFAPHSWCEFFLLLRSSIQHQCGQNIGSCHAWSQCVSSGMHASLALHSNTGVIRTIVTASPFAKSHVDVHVRTKCTGVGMELSGLFLLFYRIRLEATTNVWSSARQRFGTVASPSGGSENCEVECIGALAQVVLLMMQSLREGFKGTSFERNMMWSDHFFKVPPNQDFGAILQLFLLVFLVLQANACV